jgi:hypothetical protein
VVELPTSGRIAFKDFLCNEDIDALKILMHCS